MRATSVGGMLKEAARILGGAHNEARALMMDCLQLSDYASLLARDKDEVAADAREKFAGYVQRRSEGLPVAYILGRREFYGMEFRTTPAALIPRPETEELAAAALAHLPEGEPLRALDLGAGCGAIGLTIAKHRPHCDVLLADVDENTLRLARENAKHLGATNARFKLGDWFEAAKDEAPFDAIVCNPPYIADGDPHLDDGDLRFEPPLALRGGSDGLRALTAVINGAREHLKRGGVLLLEHGHNQAQAARELFANAGFCGILSADDLAGIPRVMLAVNP